MTWVLVIPPLAFLTWWVYEAPNGRMIIPLFLVYNLTLDYGTHGNYLGIAQNYAPTWNSTNKTTQVDGEVLKISHILWVLLLPIFVPSKNAPKALGRRLGRGSDAALIRAIRSGGKSGRHEGRGGRRGGRGPSSPGSGVIDIHWYSLAFISRKDFLIIFIGHPKRWVMDRLPRLVNIRNMFIGGWGL